MLKTIQPILDAESDARRKYPRAGQPFCSDVVFQKSNRREIRWQPHIIYSESAGEFLNYWVESEERAWEISIQKVAEMRRK